MNEQDHDNDGNNIVPCPICLDVYCPSKEDGKCPDEEEFVKNMTLQHLKEEGDKEFDRTDFDKDSGEYDFIRFDDNIKNFIHSERTKAWTTAIDIALHEIKDSPKTFGPIDKEGRGGAILVSDIEEIISKLKQ